MRRLIAVAAALTAILLYITTLGALSADEDALTTTLHPGWNLVGWIHEETPAADLFDQIDSLESIHDGSGQSIRRPVADAPADEDAALTLQPGRGYWLRIGSEQPLDWTRPAEPSTLRFQLEPGNQLVAWAGPSDRSIDDVLLGLCDQLSLAWRWIAAEQRYIPWSPNPDIPAIDAPPLNRGDAVRIDLLEPTEWLHPTGDLPRIQFAGGLHHQLPDNFREMVEADLRFVVERFAAKFQFEAPADRLILRVPTTPAALQRQQVNHAARSDAWAFSPETGGGTSIIVMPWYFWDRGDCVTSAREVPRSCSTSTLAHEYFHILQYELAGAMRARVPGWLFEGTALWSEHIVFNDPEPDVDAAQAGTNELDLAARSDRNDPAHSVGFAAVAMLVGRAGTESIVGFWENLGQIAGATSHWTTGFALTFGESYSAFLTEFAEHRKRLFTTVSGRVRTTGNQPLLEMRVDAIADQPSAWYAADVESGGRFELTLLSLIPGTTESVQYAVSIAHKGSTCAARVGPDGTLSFQSSLKDQASFVVVPDGEPAQMLDIHLPAAFCRDRLAIQLAGAYGVSGVFSVQLCIAETSGCVHASRPSTGRFEAPVPFEGEYWIRVTDHTGGLCNMYVAGDSLTRYSESASRFSSSESPEVVRVRLDSASDSCVTGLRDR